MGHKGKLNPRLTGRMDFLNPENRELLASEGIICTGEFGCNKDSSKSCQVALKLYYTREKTVKVYVRENNHGVNFKPDAIKIKIPQHIREKIRKNDDDKRKMGNVGTSASEEYLRLSLEISRDNLSFLPTPKEINNILYYHRRRHTKLDEIEWVQKFIDASTSTLYPKSIVDRFDNNKPLVVVMMAGGSTMSEFVRITKNQPSIIGMDSQYVTNNARLPVTVICAQNEYYNTVPAFVAVMGKSDAVHYELVLKKVKKYLLKEYNYELKGFAMIDKDMAERNALIACGFKVLLCDFHAIKTFNETIPKFFKNKELHLKCFKLVIQIQRSEDLIEYEENKENLIDFCKLHKKEKFWDYLRANWLNDTWEDSWINMNRPGDRKGLWNTNNSCESFFKKLLRTFLKGIGGRSVDAVLEIFEKNVFKYYDNYFSQICQGMLIPRENPSTTRDRIAQVQFVDYCGKHAKVLSNGECYTVDLENYRCSCEPKKGKCVHAKYCEQYLLKYVPENYVPEPVRRKIPRKQKPGRKKKVNYSARCEKSSKSVLAKTTSQSSGNSGPKHIVPPQSLRSVPRRNANKPWRFR